MPIGVLEPFTGQSGATSGRPHDEAPRHLVTGCPHRVSGALETKHRVEDVDGNHRLPVGRIRGSGRGESRKRSGLIDSGVKNLTLRAFLVGEQKLAVH